MCTSQVKATQVQVLGYSSEVQIRLALHFVPFPGLSSSGDQVFGECGRCDLSPPLSVLLLLLGVQLVHLLRRMLTVQNLKKSWLATKSSCSLVDDASLGPHCPFRPCLPFSSKIPQLECSADSCPGRAESLKGSSLTSSFFTNDHKQVVSDMSISTVLSETL